MAKIHCPYCHFDVDERDYPDQQEDHLEPRPDGQQAEYVTLPEEDREQGDLDGVPQPGH